MVLLLDIYGIIQLWNYFLFTKFLDLRLNDSTVEFAILNLTFFYKNLDQILDLQFYSFIFQIPFKKLN